MEKEDRMGGLPIIGADDRMRQQRGVKLMVLGQAGVGKTSLLRTLDPSTVLFCDLESGDLAVQDLRVDQLRPQTWSECRDLACFLAGPNPNVRPKDVYGQEHYDACIQRFGSPDALKKYDTVFIDSLSVAGRLCFAWAEHQPESLSAKGEKNLLGTYGLLGRELVLWITRMQHARITNIVFVCLLDEKEDDFKRKSWAMQIDGAKAAREIPGIVDCCVTLAIIRPDDGEPYRAFVTNPDNPFGFPAKDRSGRLDPMEKPHLGDLFNKLNDTARGQSAKTAPRAAA
jgi:hypothetical protein